MLVQTLLDPFHSVRAANAKFKKDKLTKPNTDNTNQNNTFLTNFIGNN
jgi:hypothetical protein